MSILPYDQVQHPGKGFQYSPIVDRTVASESSLFEEKLLYGFSMKNETENAKKASDDKNVINDTATVFVEIEKTTIEKECTGFSYHKSTGITSEEPL